MNINIRRDSKFIVPHIKPVASIDQTINPKKTKDVIRDSGIANSKIKLYKEKLKHEHICEKLRIAKAENEMQRMNLKDQWRELKEHEEMFCENFKKFNDFLKWNTVKRERSRHYITKLRKAYEKRQNEIDVLRSKYEVCKRSHLFVDKQLRTHRLYFEFMNQASDFLNLKPIQIILRYQKLDAVREKQIRSLSERIHFSKVAYNNFKESFQCKINSICYIRNRMANLEIRYRDTKMKLLMYEHVVEKIKHSGHEILSYLARNKKAINSMYVDINFRINNVEKRRPMNDYYGQLCHLKFHLRILKIIQNYFDSEETKSKKERKLMKYFRKS